MTKQRIIQHPKNCSLYKKYLNGKHTQWILPIYREHITKPPHTSKFLISSLSPFISFSVQSLKTFCCFCQNTYKGIQKINKNEFYISAAYFYTFQDLVWEQELKMFVKIKIPYKVSAFEMNINFSNFDLLNWK